jgi:hypothetical protein
MIALTRTGGMRPPRLDERLDVADDGTFQLWRSVGTATLPATPIGSFAGRLSDAQRRSVGEAAHAAAEEGSREWSPLPDSPVDRVQVSGVSATLGIHENGDGAWPALIRLVRDLLVDLTGLPSAAIALEGNGGGAELVHRGTNPLRLDLSSLSIRAVHWRGDDSQGTWTTDAPSSQDVLADAGWRLTLPLDHGFEPRPGDRIVVRATFAAHDGERMVPVSVQQELPAFRG